MDKKSVDDALANIIEEAKKIGIPLADNISGSVLVNSRPKKRYGCCRKAEGEYKIEISEFILQCDDNKILGVLAHELLHTCEGAFAHGKIWKLYAQRMNEEYGYNIKRVSSFEEMGLPQNKADTRGRYLLRCRRCGREYRRQRRSRIVRKPENYRCRCGGRLELVNIESLYTER